MKIKNALKRFAYETFRPRTKEDYTELFTRGRGGDEKTPYPWFYARVLLISLLLFTMLCVGYSLSDLNFLMVAAAGGFFADLTFIILLAEIYPKRDLPLLTPIVALFAGGVLSSAFIYILYGIANFSMPYAAQVWTAFVEETGKALTIIIILLIVKKRNPFACFIIGAAVGGGYSAFENMWRIYTQGYIAGGLSEAINIGLWRAMGTPFSHAAWAGLFGWALAFKKSVKWWRPRKAWVKKLFDWALAGEKTWLSWKPYAAYAFGYVMHFFVNFPEMTQFKVWYGYAISAVTGVLSIALIIYLIAQSRRQIVGRQSTGAQLPYMHGYPKVNGTYTQTGGGKSEYSVGNSAKSRFIANVLAAAAIFCFSFTLLGPTRVFGGYTNYSTSYYDNWQDVLNVVQGGRNLTPDYEREYVDYVDLSANYSYVWTDGELATVVQRQQYGSYFYRYTYGYTTYNVTYLVKYEDEDGNVFVKIRGKDIQLRRNADGELPDIVRVWEIKSVGLELNGVVYYPHTFIDYSKADDNVYLADAPAASTTYRYFHLNSSVLSVSMSTDGTYEVILRDHVPIRMTESVIFSAVFFAAFIGCGVAYIIYRRRIKNAER